MEPAYILLIASAAWLGVKWGIAMYEWVRGFMAPFYVVAVVFGAVWGGWKSARKRWKEWYRKPTYGDAKFAEWGDVKQNQGFPVGKMGKNLVRLDREDCAVMFGIRGAGKSVAIGRVLLEADGETLIIQDSTRDLIKRFRGELEAKGYRVVVVDLDEPTRGVGFNPVDYIKDADRWSRDRDLKELSDLLVAELKGGKDERWMRLASVFIKGVLDWADKEEPEKASPEGVASVLLEMGEGQREQVLGQIRVSGRSGKLAVNAWQGVGSNERGSFQSTVTDALEPWTWDTMATLTGTQERVNWSEVYLGAEPVALFLCGGMMAKDTTKHFSRMLFGQAAGWVARAYIRNGRLPRDTLFLVDEGAVLGGCEPLVLVVEQMRKAGCRTFICYQDSVQMDSSLGKRGAHVVASNSALIITGGLNDAQFYGDIAKLMGSKTVNPISKQVGGESVGESARYLMDEGEMRGLKKDELLVLWRGKPMRLKTMWQVIKGDLQYR